MSVRIIVDSTVDMPDELKDQFLIVPLTVRFGDEEFIDGVTIDKKRFYERLVESDVLPTTSQATPDAFQRVFADVAKNKDSAVVITISSKLSGTYQSACIAAQEYDNIFVVDSMTVAIGSGILAEYALQLAKSGRSAEKIAEALLHKREEVSDRAAGHTGVSEKRRAHLQNRRVCRRCSEYQAGAYRAGRRAGCDRKSPGLKAGKQPAGRKDQQQRRDRFCDAHSSGVFRFERCFPQEVR